MNVLMQCCFMKSIPDLILDMVEDPALKERYPEPDDGEMSYNPYMEDENIPDEANDREFMYKVREQRIRSMFRQEFHPRFGRYAVVLIIGALVAIAPQVFLNNQIKLEVVGIWLTILGSVILGRSLLRGPYSVIMENSMKVPIVDGSNMEPETKEYIHSTIDGITGILYLVLGFGLQFLSIF